MGSLRPSQKPWIRSWSHGLRSTNCTPIPGIMSSPIRVPYSNRRWGFGNGPQGAETPSAMRQLMNPDPAHLVSGGTPGGADPHHFDFLCDYEDPLLFGSPAPALSG